MKPSVNNLDNLALAIQESHSIFLKQVQKQVNVAFTLRNWVIGRYIFEYEQSGEDRAQYGEQVLNKLAEKLKGMEVKGLSHTNLHLCKKFYLNYPQILQALPEKLQLSNYQSNEIFQTLSEKFDDLPQTPSKELVGKLSFSHFIELIRCDKPLKRLFYETECLVNNWSVRELQRAINSMLYERTGLSKNKRAVLDEMKSRPRLKPENYFRDPYVLEFLELDEELSHVETDLEKSIIDNLQKFLLELGRGFCFEARQKRITFDNTHYRIDLVFYHRILQCHVLIDLKLGKFTPADAGQMNMYLNFYKENEMQEGGNPPIGIILCADKDETLVKYATAGLSDKMFVTKYLTNMPTEKQLKAVIEEEQSKAD